MNTNTHTCVCVCVYVCILLNSNDPDHKATLFVGRYARRFLWSSSPIIVNQTHYPLKTCTCPVAFSKQNLSFHGLPEESENPIQ